MAIDLKNDPSLKKMPEGAKVIFEEYVENIQENGSFTGFKVGSRAAEYIRSWKPTDTEALRASLNEYASKHNGLLEGFTDVRTGQPLVDPNTSKAYTVDAFMKKMQELSLSHYATIARSPVTLQVNGKNVRVIGQPATEQTATEQKKEEEKGFWAWCKRNWAWLLAAGTALGAGLGLLLRKTKTKTNTVYVEKEGGSSIPKPDDGKTPGGDKEPSNPGNDDGPGAGDTPSGPAQMEPGFTDGGNEGSGNASGTGSGSTGNEGTGGGTLADAGQTVPSGGRPDIPDWHDTQYGR